jgi:hypothetical protein
VCNWCATEIAESWVSSCSKELFRFRHNDKEVPSQQPTPPGATTAQSSPCSAAGLKSQPVVHVKMVFDAHGQLEKLRRYICYVL